MKKALLVIAILLLLAIVGAAGFLWYSYENTGHESVPKVEIEAFGGKALPMDYTWSTPVAGGLLYKDFVSPVYDLDMSQLHTGAYEVGAVPQEMALPEGYEITLRITRDDVSIFEDAPTALDWALLEEPGEYYAVFELRKTQGDRTGQGRLGYVCAFTVTAPPEPEEPEFVIPDEPEFVAGNTTLQQGDIFSMAVKWLPEGVVPTASTDLGMAVFTPGEDGCWFAAVPVGNARGPGEYRVDVQAGEYSYEATVTVETFPFDTQDLIIDTSNPVISEANSAEAYAQYNAKIPPLFDTYEEERYWEGLFIQPAQGWISTNFGEIRYTNGDYSNPRSHMGMDIAAAEGSDVIAPNNGRVIFAEYLLNTGWTIVIEHGGGLKSLYYHMLEINVETGNIVETGQLIGKVGTTGYSTGAHLHFEMRIGNQAVSPQMLFLESAGLYSAEGLPAEEDDTEAPAA